MSDAKRGGFTVLNIYELMPYLIDSEYKGPSTSQSYEDTFKIERYLGYKDVLESYFFYTQINFEVAFVSIKGHVATITKTNKEANSYRYYDDYKGFIPYTEERDTLLIYYLLKNINSITKLITVTKDSNMPDGQNYIMMKAHLNLD